jgi:hypothetical protein
MEFSTLAQVNRRLGDLEELIRIAMAGGGGGGGADVPFSRFKWIDGGTTATGHNGSIAQPYSTISQFLAAIPVSATAGDSQAMIVGAVTPSVAGYVEPLAVPAYRNIEIKAENLNFAGGSSLTGNIAWANVAGTNHAPTTIAFLVLHNVSQTGNITITDDVVVSEVFLINDEWQGLGLTGNITANTTTNFLALNLLNYSVTGTINCGSTANSAAMIATNGIFSGGPITVKSLTAVGCQFAESINFGSAVTAKFTGCQFTGSPVITGGNATTSTVLMDGPSWKSFQENGGTVATGIAMVIGGYSGGAVAGQVLTNANVSVGLNGTGATAGFTGGGNWYSLNAATLTGAHTVTLLTGAGELPGDTILITRVDDTANTYTVINGGVGGGNIAVLPANVKGSCLASFNGVNWVLADGGSDFT